MPKNPVTDPITDQEMAFAHLILSGTINDRQAAEAVGLNPDTAAYTKSKPRVRDYMIEHRAAVREKLVDQEVDLSRRAVEGLRKLNLGRDQVLARLWELAYLSHEVTRGSIAGQMKALSMIIAIEGLIPDRRVSPAATQPTAPPANAQIHFSEWRRQQQHQAAGGEPNETPAPQAQPSTNQVPEPPPPPPLAQNHSVLNPFVIPEGGMRVPEATRNFFDVALDTPNSLSLPLSLKKGPPAHRR
jgi:hypothetical protein